jgi:hypothetical protein
MEGLAKLVFEEINTLAGEGAFTDGDSTMETNARNVRVVSVTCWEDSKNSATYFLP